MRCFFFAQNRFSWPNGQLLPIAYHTYSEIYCSSGYFGISGDPLVHPVIRPIFCNTRPKPAFGRQGLDWDRWARIQFSQVHFGAKLDSTDLLWCKNVTSPTGGSNRPFRCLEEGGRALPKFLAPFQNVSKKHSGYDLLLNKYSGGFREITILM